MKEIVDVTIEGLIYSLSGFGEILRNIVLTLDGMGVYVRLIPHGGIRGGIARKDQRLFEKLAKRYDGVKPYSTFLYFGTPLGCRKYETTHSVVWTMFETQETPYDFVRHVDKMDEVWFPSKFCFDTFTKAGLGAAKAKIMPLGVNTNVFTPKERYIPPSDTFKFGTVVGWSERKGVSMLLKSYLEEFNRDKDNVLLIIRGGYYPKEKIIAEIDLVKREATKVVPRDKQCDIYLCYRIIPVNKMPDFFKMLNCIMYPSYGEGFGMCILEGMSCGIPSIATNATGHIDFCNDTNSYLINVARIDKEPRCAWITAYYRYPFPNEQNRGATFAIPDQKHLQQLMRHAYQNREEVKQKGLKAREDVVKNWDIRLICEKVYNRLLEIQRQRGVHPPPPQWEKEESGVRTLVG